MARASAAARGVSFIFGRFFGQKLENPKFCVVSTRRCFGYFFHSCLSCFLVTFLRNCCKYHVFRLLVLMILGVRCEVFAWKASKTRGFCMVDVSRVKQQEGNKGFTQQPAAFEK